MDIIDRMDLADLRIEVRALRADNERLRAELASEAEKYKEWKEDWQEVDNTRAAEVERLRTELAKRDFCVWCGQPRTRCQGAGCLKTGIAMQEPPHG